VGAFLLIKLIMARPSIKEQKVERLKELWLKTGTEDADKGFFWRIKNVLFSLGGSVDKNAEILQEITDIINNL